MSVPDSQKPGDLLENPRRSLRYRGVMFRLSLAFLMGGHAVAAPLPVAPFTADGADSLTWHVPGGAGIALAPKAASTLKIDIPSLTDKEREAGGDWHGLIAVDLHGTPGGTKGEILLEALDPATGEPFATTRATVSGSAPRAAWSVIASSEQPGEAAARAFDGDPKTIWHSKYQVDGPKMPEWIGLELGTPTALPGIRYTPRPDGGGNGAAREFRLEIRKPGGAWETAVTGTAPHRETVEIRIPRPIPIEAFRLVIDSDHGDGFGSAGEIEPIGLTLKPELPITAASRAWLEIPADLTAKLEGKSFALRVRNSPAATVVLGTPRLARLHTAPSNKLFGRSNGGLGPDLLSAGLLGFTALTEHEQTALTLMSVLPDSPAAAAGLAAGDVLLAIAGKPLPLNDLSPGWNWFHHSHEAVIGRTTEAALKAGKTSLPIAILRDGKPHTVQVPLRRDRPFTTLDPATDPQAAKLLADQIALLERTQRDDGSWSGGVIQTTFSALALMATQDVKHRERVANAVSWLLKKHPTPEAFGNLGFWFAGYAGILYAEWHLATGDESVLPHLDAIRDWAVAGHHICKWDVPALGHGTDGLPYDNKALVAPACHLLVAEALAMRCGRDSGIWELLLPYMELSWSDPKDGGHGSLGYNPSYKDTEEFWSRSGVFAMAAHLRDQRPDMRDAMTSFMAKSHPWIRNSHAYGEPGGALGLLGLNLAAPGSFKSVLRDYAWSFSLAWEPGHGLRFTTPHMGAPYMGEEDLINPAYALVLLSHKKSLHLTGSTQKGLWAIR